MDSINLLGFILTFITLPCIGNVDSNAAQANSSPANNANVLTFEKITKSKQDQSLYRGLQLANNLTVLLISDPNTDVSAAALAVGVGWMYDFKELPGIAHFLEHMLFMGNKKYPQEDGWRTYVYDHAGDYRGCTGVDLTNFGYQVDPGSFNTTIDMLSQFFLTPLISNTSMHKEVKVVDSEYQMYLSDDIYRFTQLQVSLSKPDHPYNHFYVGSLQTLETEPEKKGIKVHDKLLEFHSTWYSSNIMTLAVLGTESLDELQNMVIPLFKDIPNKNVKQMQFTYAEHPWGPEQLKRKLYVVPLADSNQLKLIFPTPDYRDQYKKDPATYIGNFIQQEGPGSLLTLLKNKNLASSLLVEYVAYCGFGFFSTTLDLTASAVNGTNSAVDEVITLLFQYIQLLNTEGIQERIFNENKKISHLAFDYKDKDDPQEYVTFLTTWMEYIAMEDILTFSYLADDWDPALIKEFLTYITPNNMNVFVISKSFENIADKTEPWYGTKYKQEMMSDDLIKKWSSTGLSPDLQLPPPNVFIPENLNLYPLDKNAPKDPYIIRETSLSQIWFLQDSYYLLPKLNLQFQLISPVANKGPHTRNLQEMVARILQDLLSDCIYAAQQTGIQLYINASPYGIELGVFGYNDKLPVFLEKLTARITNFTIDQNRFEILKDTYISYLNSFESQDFPDLSDQYWTYLEYENEWTNDQLLDDAMKNLQSDQVKKFASEMFSNIYIQGLIYGNCNEQKAKDIINIIEAPFESSQRVHSKALRQLRQTEIKAGSNLMYEVTNQYQKDSAYYAYIQCGTDTPLNNSLLQLLYTIVSGPIFTVLRTQEQLGYVVYCDMKFSRGAQGFLIFVESDQHPIFVNSRVEAYLQSLQETLDNMSEQDFEAAKMDTAQYCLQKPTDLVSMSNIYWIEIVTRYYNFERSQKDAERVKSIKKEQLVQFYKTYIEKSSSTRSKLDIHIISTISNPKIPEGISVEETKIQDINAYKSSSTVYFAIPPPDNNIAPLGNVQP